MHVVNTVEFCAIRFECGEAKFRVAGARLLRGANRKVAAQISLHECGFVAMARGAPGVNAEGVEVARLGVSSGPPGCAVIARH